MRGQRKNRRNTQSLIASQPRNFDPNPIRTRRFRFSVSATVGGLTGSISGSCLLNLLHTSATAATSYAFHSAVRVLRVEIFGSPVTGLTGNSSCALTWLGLHAPPRHISDAGTVQVPGHVSSGPNANSFASLWTVTGAPDVTAPLFNVACVAGGVIDVVVQTMDPDGLLLGSRPLTCAGATVGQQYHNYLDNTAANAVTVGASLLIPDGNVLALVAFG